MDVIPNWLRTGTDGVVGFLPSLIGGLITLLIGYVAAILLRRVTRSLLHRVGFDRLALRLGVSDLRSPGQASHWAGTAVFAVVMLATLMQVARVWNLGFIAVGLASVLAYLPHVLGAALIFAAALFFGNWVRDRMLMRSETSEMPRWSGGQTRIVASAVRGGILTIGAFMALRELQIGSEIVTIGFALVLGAIALAAALAFGLGSRDVAGSVARQWYDQRMRGNGSGSRSARSTLGYEERQDF